MMAIKCFNFKQIVNYIIMIALILRNNKGPKMNMYLQELNFHKFLSMFKKKQNTSIF